MARHVTQSQLWMSSVTLSLSCLTFKMMVGFLQHILYVLVIDNHIRMSKLRYDIRYL